MTHKPALRKVPLSDEHEPTTGSDIQRSPIVNPDYDHNPSLRKSGWWAAFYDNYDLRTYLIADKDDVDTIITDGLTEEQAEAICVAHNAAMEATNAT